MDCRVVVEAAVPVYDVQSADEAVRIAISKTGEMLNPDLNYVEIEMGERHCPHCNEELQPAFVAADESLVALELEMTVFNVERNEHASRIARKEIGQRLENIPLEVLSVDVVEEPEDGDEESDRADEDAVEDDEVTDEGSNDSDNSDSDNSDSDNSDSDNSDSDNSDSDNSDDSDDSNDVMPSVDEMVDNDE